jgi:hypothetical protein
VRAQPFGRRSDDHDVLVDLLAQNVQLDEDVIVLGEQVWAIHGYIAYDGEVIAATFASEHEARVQLSRLDGLVHTPR